MIMQLPVALIPRSRPPRHTKEDRGGEKADTREPLRHNGLPCFCPLFPFFPKESIRMNKTL